MISIFDISEFFLNKNQPNSQYEITHLKLQKLLYYAQAWHLAAFDGVPLFNEDFEAWVHGPVNRDIYNKFKDNGYSVLPVSKKINFELSSDQQKLLDTIWDHYGSCTGKYLEELTHQEKPWVDTRGNLKNHENCSEVILKEEITKYYKDLLN